jgi:hypothetical protein
MRVLGQPLEDDPSFRRKVGLFTRKFLGGLKQNHVEFFRAIKPYQKWQSELPELRDPAAHRIPLYFVPCVVTPDQAQQWQELYFSALSDIERIDPVSANKKFEEMSGIGSFVPVFGHSFRRGELPLPIYAQLGSDLSALSGLSGIVLDYMLHHAP